MRIARNRDADARADGDDLVDADVPAAVVCAHCGAADCAGCFDDLTKSGVVAIVAWERPGGSALGRLWSTACATTFSADRFFESLPDGPLAPAVRFAVASELVAASAMAAALLVPVAVLAPAWLKHVFVDETAFALRLIGCGVPGVAGLLVGAHVAHGWALDFGARRSGARAETRRALRFGLYAAGWDLVVGPLGAAVVAAQSGVRAAASIAGTSLGLPTRSARAFLRGCYRLEGSAATPAMRASYVAAALATAVGAAAVIAALAAAILR